MFSELDWKSGNEWKVIVNKIKKMNEMWTGTILKIKNTMSCNKFELDIVGFQSF